MADLFQFLIGSLESMKNYTTTTDDVQGFNSL